MGREGRKIQELLIRGVNVLHLPDSPMEAHQQEYKEAQNCWLLDGSPLFTLKTEQTLHLLKRLEQTTFPLKQPGVGKNNIFLSESNNDTNPNGCLFFGEGPPWLDFSGTKGNRRCVVVVFFGGGLNKRATQRTPECKALATLAPLESSGIEVHEVRQ